MQAKPHRSPCVGQWLLNGYHTRLIARPDWQGGQGQARLPTAEDPLGLVEVGVQGTWLETLDSLIHETLELVLTAEQHVWPAPVAAFHSDTATRHFCFDHIAFTECCRRASDFWAPAIPALAAAYKTLNKERQR